MMNLVSHTPHKSPAHFIDQREERRATRALLGRPETQVRFSRESRLCRSIQGHAKEADVGRHLAPQKRTNAGPKAEICI